MASESQRLADQLHRAYAGPAWHGPALRRLLRGITAKQAAARPLRNAHTVWELVLHITAWKRAVLRRMQGHALSLSPAQNFPPMPNATAANWQSTLAALQAAQQDLHRAVAALPESRLKRIVPGKRYTLYFMLHGLVQHDLYHAGQIALLKKARR
ncbi:MAG TPA: DinB family protein [Terriglobales bacterium]|nr:DinB family protein [Terriglobales bacterium]